MGEFLTVMPWLLAGLFLIGWWNESRTLLRERIKHVQQINNLTYNLHRISMELKLIKHEAEQWAKKHNPTKA